jgi:hypothetical protein
MQNSELFKIACQCLLLNDNPQLQNTIQSKVLTKSIDLEKFILLCSNHLVLPAIYLRLNDSGIMNFFALDFQSHLKEIYELNVKRNSEILQQIKELCSILDKHSIEPVFLKGTANLLDNLYSNLGDRMIGDIDLLVREKDYFKTAELILEAGYLREDVRIFDNLNSIKHYPRLYRDDVPADIEIHRIPTKKIYPGKFDSDIIFYKKVEIQTIKNCYLTCDEHKLIHTFIHSQLSNKGYIHKIAPLRDLYDFYLISKRIDFYSILPKIEEKKKAISFFNLGQYMFEPENSSYFANKQVKNKYIRQIIWFLNHPAQHRFYVGFMKATDIFIERPFYKIKNAFLNKESRISLFKRFKNPDWYRTIYIGIRSHFN